MMLGLKFTQQASSITHHSILFLNTQSLALPNAPEVTTLELGTPVERELTGAQEHGYQM